MYTLLYKCDGSLFNMQICIFIFKHLIILTQMVFVMHGMLVKFKVHICGQ